MIEGKTNIASTKNLFEKIHKRALLATKNFKRAEIELIEALEEVDRNRVYYHQGYNSLFKYATDALALSEEVAYIFINVCRKAREVPALKQEIKSGALTVSKAKRITSVLTPQNQSYWLGLAKSSSKKTLEKTVASVSPKAAVREQLTYVHPDLEVKEHVKIINLGEASQEAMRGMTAPIEKSRVQMQVGISERLMLKIRRVQDILSQKREKSVDLEAVLSAAVELYIEKNDPLEKAKRRLIKSNPAVSNEPAGSGEPKRSSESSRPGKLGPGPLSDSIRKPIPAHTRHKLWLEQDGRCTHLDENNKRCHERRFLHVHHERPVSRGGTNDLTNLSLLCAGHHRIEHLRT